MTPEAEVRVRLLAHYEDRIEMLRALVASLRTGLALMTGVDDRKTCRRLIATREAEIAKVEVDAGKLIAVSPPDLVSATGVRYPRQQPSRGPADGYGSR